jgi:biotin-(acetyl-CoA carboxylase) ligase
MWQRYDVLNGHRITVVEGGRRHDGTMVGVDGDGALLLRDDQGRRQHFRSGEVTLERESVP